MEVEATEVPCLYANGVSPHSPVLEKGWMPEVFRRHPTLGAESLPCFFSVPRCVSVVYPFRG